ncbi:MAG: ATPase P [Desulfobacterales bacterium]|jgi:soluble P-type ATPase
MLEIDIPGRETLRLKHIVLDYNGTIACDGALIAGVNERLAALADMLQVHVLTADTFGKAQEGLEGIACRLSVLSRDAQDIGKLNYVKGLGAEHVICVGNGRNDRLMLKAAALGIAIIFKEGAAADTIAAADIVCTDIVSALELLQHPLRLIATMRT